MTQHLLGDCRQVLRTLPDGGVHCCVTSPPYWGLRDYGADGQIGQEEKPEQYVESLVGVFREVRRVLRDDGTLWLNLGDCFFGGAGAPVRRAKDASGVQRPKLKLTCERCGKEFEGTNRRRFCSAFCGGIDNSPRRSRPPYFLKPKDLIGMPWRVAFALQQDGWYLRSEIVWHKPNAMPDSVRDRPTRSHEQIFLLSKSVKYHYDGHAVREASGANKRSVWSVPTRPYPGAHFAVFPPELIRPCVLAGCPAGGTVLDPFGGSGTTALVAEQEGRNALLIELNPDYIDLQKHRTVQAPLLSA